MKRVERKRAARLAKADSLSVEKDQTATASLREMEDDNQEDDEDVSFDELADAELDEYEELDGFLVDEDEEDYGLASSGSASKRTKKRRNQPQTINKKRPSPVALQQKRTSKTFSSLEEDDDEDVLDLPSDLSDVEDNEEDDEDESESDEDFSLEQPGEDDEEEEGEEEEEEEDSEADEEFEDNQDEDDELRELANRTIRELTKKPSLSKERPTSLSFNDEEIFGSKDLSDDEDEEDDEDEDDDDSDEEYEQEDEDALAFEGDEEDDSLVAFAVNVAKTKGAKKTTKTVEGKEMKEQIQEKEDEEELMKILQEGISETKKVTKDTDEFWEPHSKFPLQIKQLIEKTLASSSTTESSSHNQARNLLDFVLNHTANIKDAVQKPTVDLSSTSLLSPSSSSSSRSSSSKAMKQPEEERVPRDPKTGKINFEELTIVDEDGRILNDSDDEAGDGQGSFSGGLRPQLDLKSLLEIELEGDKFNQRGISFGMVKDVIKKASTFERKSRKVFVRNVVTALKIEIRNQKQQAALNNLEYSGDRTSAFLMRAMEEVGITKNEIKMLALEDTSSLEVGKATADRSGGRNKGGRPVGSRHKLNPVVKKQKVRAFYDYYKGDYEKAKKRIQSILKFDPGLSDCYRILAEIHKETGQPDKYFFCKLLESVTDWKNADWMKMVSMSLERGDIPTALSCYNRHSRLHPTDLDALWDQHILHLVEGKTKKASADLISIAQFVPRHPLVNFKIFDLSLRFLHEPKTCLTRLESYIQRLIEKQNHLALSGHHLPSDSLKAKIRHYYESEYFGPPIDMSLVEREMNGELVLAETLRKKNAAVHSSILNSQSYLRHLSGLSGPDRFREEFSRLIDLEALVLFIKLYLDENSIESLALHHASSSKTKKTLEKNGEEENNVMEDQTTEDNEAEEQNGTEKNETVQMKTLEENWKRAVEMIVGSPLFQQQLIKDESTRKEIERVSAFPKELSFMCAVQHLREGHFEEAKKMFEQFTLGLIIDTHLYDFYFLAEHFVEKQQYRDAIKIFDRLLHIVGDSYALDFESTFELSFVSQEAIVDQCQFHTYMQQINVGKAIYDQFFDQLKAKSEPEFGLCGSNKDFSRILENFLLFGTNAIPDPRELDALEQEVRKMVGKLSIVSRLSMISFGENTPESQRQRIDLQIEKERRHLSLLNLALRRALCYEKTGNVVQALKDFQWIVERRSVSHEAARGIAAIYRTLNYSPEMILPVFDRYVRAVLKMRKESIEEQRKKLPLDTPIISIIQGLSPDLEVNPLVLVERLRLQLQLGKSKGYINSIWLLFSSKYLKYNSRHSFSSRFNPTLTNYSGSDARTSSIKSLSMYFTDDRNFSVGPSARSFNASSRTIASMRIHLDQYIQSLIGEDDLTDLITTTAERLGDDGDYEEAVKVLKFAANRIRFKITGNVEKLRTMALTYGLKTKKDNSSFFRGLKVLTDRHPFSLRTWKMFVRFIDKTEYTTNTPRFVNNQLDKHPQSVPIRLLNGHHFLTSGTTKRALEEYIKIYHTLNGDPFLHLFIGVAMLGMSLNRKLPDRHLMVTKAFAFLFEYKRIRCEKKRSAFTEAETSYNVGRAFHQLSLFQFAIFFYNKVLDLSSTLPPRSNLAREAAFNLCLIYNTHGASHLAHTVMRTHLSF